MADRDKSNWMRVLAVVGVLVLSGCNASSVSTSSSSSSARSSAGGASGIVGTWNGSVTYLDASAPIRFVLGQDGGAIVGQQVLFDPTSGATIGAGPISGQNVGGSAHWNTLGNGLVVNGAFKGSSFTGTAQMMTPDGGTFSASLELSQGGAQ